MNAKDGCLGEKTPKTPPFAKFPAWIRKFGVLAQLSGTETKVLILLCTRADNKSGNCCPTHKTIASEAGVGLNSISDITMRLVMHSVIKKWRRGYRVYYHIEAEPPGWLKETGQHWMPDKLPRNPPIYRRENASGKFTSEKPIILDPEKSPSGIPEGIGNGLKSSQRSLDGEV